ncbi:MAG TPA: hemerythrin family protein [Anaerolineaceae bacterium]|nr:hemerythrin family protein [Anaerolineaceae bacterium]
MAKPIFDFDAEFKLGIEAVDSEHVKLVNMLNEVHALIGAGRREDARVYFNQTLGLYVIEHFANEEKFMESIGFPGLEAHKQIHTNFKKSFQELQPLIASYDDDAFRKALSDAFSWILTHIGKTDKRYAQFYAQKN